MDETEFFREATISICGNLEIEKALFSCLQVLRKVMPVDRMYLQHFDPEYNSMRTIAAATVSNSSVLDLLTPLSEEARASARRQDLPLEQEVFIFDDPQNYAISREMLEFQGISRCHRNVDGLSLAGQCERIGEYC